MGSRVVGISGLSIPVLLTALFVGENGPNPNNNLASGTAHLTPTINNNLPRQSINNQRTDVLQNFFGAGFNSFFNFKSGPVILNNEYAQTLSRIDSFKGREIYIKNLLQNLNPQLLPVSSVPGEETALSVFNRRYNLSLVCMGIKDKPAEFIFIDNNYFLGRNQTPLRIALTLQEVTSVKTKQDLEQLLENKYNNHKIEMCEQHAVWAVPYRYDFQKNNGACMFALSLSGLSGMETDLVRALEMYTRGFGMSVEAMCIDPIHREELSRVLERQHFDNIPEIVPATKNEILSQFEKALKKAIDERKSVFMFHYMEHGSSDGRIWASDGAFMPEDIAKVISRSYKGRPLCEQIDITIWAGSCYSGKQLEGIKEYCEQRRNISVRNLRIITESKYTTAGAGTTPQNASLVSDLMTDDSGPLDYYKSWYREYLQYLEEQGVRIQRPAGSYLHEVRFADLMSRFDTSNNQDSQGFHYSNNSETGNIIEQYFTQLKPLISESQNGEISAVA